MVEPRNRSAAELCERYLDALNQRRLGDLDDFVVPEYRSHTRVGDIVGLDHFKAICEACYSGFPDIYWVTDERIISADRFVLRYHWESRHARPFLGIPATNKMVHAEGLELVHCLDGWLVEVWNYSDLMGLAAQLHSPHPLELEI